MRKAPEESVKFHELQKQSLGLSPAVLAKRDLVKPDPWCLKPDIEYDPFCDPYNPKTILYKDIVKAAAVVKESIQETPIVKSRCCEQFELNLYYKMEIFNNTGSFHDRSAVYALRMLTDEQRDGGIYTASLGNWAMALSFHAGKLNIPITVVLPSGAPTNAVEKCQEYGANVVQLGEDVAEAKIYAFSMIDEDGRGTYINGYDHPHVIAAAGSIGIEILEEVPKTDVILVPIGGGGLVAGIATAVKHLKPGVRIYGIEPKKCSCFYKAIENEKPYRTVPGLSVAESLAVPTAGCNSFHTAISLIDKMVLVEDDWITRAILHLVEEEKVVPEGAGATSLAALMAIPNVLPELRDKTVVCVVTGGNIDIVTLPHALERGVAIEGRSIKMTILLSADNPAAHLKVYSIISNLGCNILHCYRDHASWTEDDFFRDYEDFDEFCDPENPRAIKQEEVLDAANRIRGHVVHTPCLASHCSKDYSMKIFYKLEFLQKSGSFKERGTLNALQMLPLDKKKIGVVLASIGNEALGLCCHASKMNIPVIAVLPVNINIDVIQRCQNYGAKVVLQGGNLMETQRYARAIAREKGLTYINGRDHPNVLAGYGTVGLEIVEQMPFADAILVPVGSGGLVAAVATVVKHYKPQCLVYGVQPETMPGFFKSLENDEPMVIPVQTNLAPAITVPHVGTNSLANAQTLVDKMLLVKEDWIARAILHLVESEKFVVEGAGACTLAAIIGSLVPELKTKTVICILTGGNIDNALFARSLERGLAAEGRLVAFRVGIQNTITANSQLMRLLTNGGYNVYYMFQDNAWIDDEVYYKEVKLVCETKNLEHALELKRIIERAYPCTSVFETEPFNDKRTCPCYVRKSIT